MGSPHQEYDLAANGHRKRVHYFAIFPATLLALVIAVPMAYRSLAPRPALWVVLSIVAVGRGVGLAYEYGRASRGALLRDAAVGVALAGVLARLLPAAGR